MGTLGQSPHPECPIKDIPKRASWHGIPGKVTPTQTPLYGYPGMGHPKRSTPKWISCHGNLAGPLEAEQLRFHVSFLQFHVSFLVIYIKITVNITKYNHFNHHWDVKPTECFECQEWGESFGSTATGQYQKAAETQLYRGCDGRDCVLWDSAELSQGTAFLRDTLSAAGEGKFLPWECCLCKCNRENRRWRNLF